MEQPVITTQTANPAEPSIQPQPPTPQPDAPSAEQQGILGTRVSMTLNARGAKFASNSTDDGATVSVTKAEARVLIAQGMGTIAPQYSSLTPNSGPNGTTVTITGFGFLARGANSQVTFGAQAATIVNWSNEVVRVTFVKGALPNGPAAVTLRNQAMGTVACGNFTVT